MPRKILVSQRAKFWRLYREGHTILEASKRAGFSQSYGKMLVRKGMGAPPGHQANAGLDALARAEEEAEQFRPKARHELEPAALDCLDDFERFRARYLGSVSTPWQVEAAQRAVQLLDTPDKTYLVINCPQGGGKALDVETPILTTAGWSAMGKLRVGDQVYGADGKPCTVTYKSPIFHGHDCYEVRSDDGASVIADAEHLWPVRIGGEGKYKRTGRPDMPAKTGPKTRGMGGIRVQTTEFLTRKRWAKPELQLAAPLHIPDADLPVDPYVLGAWLGDGDSKAAAFTSHPDDQVYLRKYIEEAGYSTTNQSHPNRFGVVSSMGRWSRDGLKSQLRALGVLHNKHVPAAYLHASAAQRVALLQGLIDTDGHVADSGRIEFTSTNRQLAKSVQYLVRSLGRKASLAEGRATLNGKDCGPKYRVGFYLVGAARLPRKAERCRPCVRTPNRYLAVTPVPSVPTQCIAVDSPDHLYLAGRGLLVTHNTRLFSHDLTAWLTARNRALRGIFGSLSQSVSTNLCANLRDTLERTVPARARPEDLARGLARDADATLASDYGRFKPEGSGGLWRRDAIIVEQLHGASMEKEPTWAAFSREAKFLGWRVDFMVWDDLVNADMLRNPDRVEDLYNWWNIEAESRVDPGGLLLLVGQRLRSNDIYRYCLDKRVQVDEFDAESDSVPMYHHIVYRAHYEDRCTGNPADHRRDAAPYPQGCMLDPARVTWRDKLEKETAGTYMVVFQQEDTDPSNVLVQKDWVAGCWDEHRMVGQLPPIPKGSDVIRYMTVDPSPTKWWGIIDWLYVVPPDVDRTAGYRYLMDLERRKMGANDFLDRARDGTYIGLAEDWVQRAKTQGVPIEWLIMERNAAQRWAFQYEFFQDWWRTRSVQVREHETTNNKSDPTYGVWATIPAAWQFNRVRLPGGDRTSRNIVHALVQEVTTYPDGATDDLVMSQWFGEYHLPNLIGTRKAVGSLGRHRPSWMAGARPGSYIQNRVAELASQR